MRIRITFSKDGPMQYVGHLDLHRSWERTFRRSGLLLEYSHGFHPQPHLNLACALPVGFTSQCEILDAWLEQDFKSRDLKNVISQALPPGIGLVELSEIESNLPAVQTQVLSAIYRISFLDDVVDISTRLQRILLATQLPRVRRDKPYDLRPLIENATLIPAASGEKSNLQVQMSARQAATGRPEEMLAEMDIPFENTRIHREKLILINN